MTYSNRAIVNTKTLDEIDNEKDNLAEGCLENCLGKLYKTFSDMTAIQTSEADKDNRENADIVIPRFKEAMKYSINNYKGEFTFTLIQDIAGILAPEQKAKMVDYAEFRKDSRSIPGLEYVPPLDEKRIRKQLEKVIKFVKKNENLHPIEEATFLYFHIARIQPFEIANKRTAAVMMNTILNAEGYPSIAPTSVEDQLVFSNLFLNAIKGYENDMATGKQMDSDIHFNNIGWEQRAIFDYITKKIATQVKNAQEVLSKLDKYQITYLTKNPGTGFIAKKRLTATLRHGNEDSLYQVKLNRQDHIIEISGNITYKQVDSALKNIHDFKYEIHDKRDLEQKR